MPSTFNLWAPVIAYMAMIFGLSSMHRLPRLPIDTMNYGAHIVTYTGLGLLSARALAKGLVRVPWRAALGAVVIAALYGVSDEFHQTLVPGRTFDIGDMIADAIGGALGAGAAISWSIIRRRQ